MPPPKRHYRADKQIGGFGFPTFSISPYIEEVRSLTPNENMSTPLIQRILNFAHKTFRRVEGSGDIHESVSKLTELVQGFSVNDIKFDSDILTDNTRYDENIHEAPVGYVYLWDSPYFSMGIFIIRNGERIPLHNHPNMHGILKVIHGTAQINSFSKSTEEEHKEPPESLLKSLQQWEKPLVKPYLKHEPVLITTESDACVLSPVDKNTHEISAPDGTIAFLDILSPPYDEEHVCGYYKLLDSENTQTQAKGPDAKETSIHYLLKSPQPSDFFCEPLDYYGPELEDPDGSSDESESDNT